MIPQTEVPVDPTPAKDAAPAPKAGYKSSELAVTLASAVALGSGLVPAQYGPLLVSLVGVYTACRTVLKVAHSLGYAKNVPDLPDIPKQS